MVDYVPPGLKGRFHLHNISWTTRGDISNRLVMEVLVKECRMGYYDLVLIDVDRVPVIERLKIRAAFGETGVQAYCRVLVDENQAPLLSSSVAAVAHTTTTKFWGCHTYPGREFILGGLEEPVGIYQTEDPTTCIFTPPTISWTNCILENAPPINIDAHYFELTGDLAPSGDWTVTLPECRSLKSKLSTLQGYEDETDIAEMLIANHCPRKRVRALVEVVKADRFVHL